MIITLSVFPCFGKSIDKFYAPVQETLVGTVKKITFAGPPNYDDINEGDSPETCPYLILDNPVDFSTNVTNSSHMVDEKHIQLIQLALNKQSHWMFIKDGARLKVKGTLYEAHTAHHHTRVLMMVDEVYSEKSKSSIALSQVKIQCGADHGFCEVIVGR